MGLPQNNKVKRRLGFTRFENGETGLGKTAIGGFGGSAVTGWNMNHNLPERVILTFPKSRRLRKSSEFARVYGANVFVADECLVMQGIQNGTTDTRLGISVSRKVGNAVVRNNWKRLVREAFRLQQHELPSGMDIVVRPRKGAQPDFQQVKSSVLGLAKRVQQKLGRG